MKFIIKVLCLSTITLTRGFASSRKQLAINKKDLKKINLSYLVLVGLLLGTSQIACAMGNEDLLERSPQLYKKGHKPSNERSFHEKKETTENLSPFHNQTLFFDKERGMYYYGTNLSHIESAESHPVPLTADDIGVMFSLHCTLTLFEHMTIILPGNVKKLRCMKIET